MYVIITFAFNYYLLCSVILYTVQIIDYLDIFLYVSEYNGLRRRLFVRGHGLGQRVARRRRIRGTGTVSTVHDFICNN